MNQDNNKVQPQQGVQSDKPDQKSNQTPGQQTQQPTEKPGQQQKG